MVYMHYKNADIIKGQPIMNIKNNIHSQNFCAGRNAGKVIGVNIRIAPQITRLTAISNLEIGPQSAVAYTKNGEVLSTNYNNIMSVLRDAVTELSWSHQYNTQRGTWCRR